MLTVMPIKHLGLTMAPSAYRMALRYRTGRKLYSTSRACTLCEMIPGRMSTTTGDHEAAVRVVVAWDAGMIKLGVPSIGLVKGQC